MPGKYFCNTYVPLLLDAHFCISVHLHDRGALAQYLLAQSAAGPVILCVRPGRLGIISVTHIRTRILEVRIHNKWWTAAQQGQSLWAFWDVLLVLMLIL